MKRKCRYCNKEIVGGGGLGIWVTPGALSFCTENKNFPFHSPLKEEEVVTKVLNKYQDGVNM